MTSDDAKIRGPLPHCANIPLTLITYGVRYKFKNLVGFSVQSLFELYAEMYFFRVLT